MKDDKKNKADGKGKHAQRAEKNHHCRTIGLE
jgi:hypothetical protein